MELQFNWAFGGRKIIYCLSRKRIPGRRPPSRRRVLVIEALGTTAGKRTLGNSIVGTLQVDLIWLLRVLQGSGASLYSTEEKMVNQSNCFIPRHFYIVKEKGPVKKLELTSAVYTVWEGSLNTAYRAAWWFIHHGTTVPLEPDACSHGTKTWDPSGKAFNPWKCKAVTYLSSLCKNLVDYIYERFEAVFISVELEPSKWSVKTGTCPVWHVCSLDVFSCYKMHSLWYSVIFQEFSIQNSTIKNG